jgi:hypothetical protein
MKREGAFTIAEVLLALGFLATVLLAAASLFISVVKASDESARTAPALLVGRKLIEDARNQLRLNPDSVAVQDFWDQEYISTPWQELVVRAGNEDYLCRIYTSDVRNSGGETLGGRPENLLKRVRVEVLWREGRGQGYGTLSEELVTLFSR